MNRAPPSSRARYARRGQPLLVLVAVLAGWGALRASTWEVPPDPAASVAALAQAAVERAIINPLARPVQGGQSGASSTPPTAPAETAPGSFADPVQWQAAPLPQALPPILPTIGTGAPETAGQALVPSTAPAATATGAAASAGPAPVSPRLAAGHAMLMVAGFAQMRVPPEIAVYFNRATLPGTPETSGTPAQTALVAAPSPAGIAGPPAAAASGQRRWSADGWLLWRDDTTTPFTTGNPSYGRSQLGAVARYELAPRSRQRPQAYLRGSAALQGAAEQEVAVGLSARPLAGLPLRVAAEVRASDRSSGRAVRPSAYAVTELAPQRLPGGLVAEVYAQAGYVGGRDATAFVDGQARVDRSLATAGDFDLRAGAAVWGGAQDEAARLDVGPTASLAFRVGETRGRLAADYRFRVAGDAEPASGPALTLSAGF